MLKKIHLDTISNQSLKIKTEYYQKKTSSKVFIMLSIFSLIPYIFSILFAIKNRDVFTVFFDSVIYIGLLAIILLNIIPIKVKSIILLGLLYSLGIFLLYKYGYSSTANLWLFSLTIIAALLLGKKVAYLTMFLNLIIYISFIPLILHKKLPWNSSITDVTVNHWVIHGGTYLILSSTIAIALSIYLSGFTKILNHVFSTKKATILGLAKLAEHRDTDTGDHILRLNKYSGIIASYIYKNHNFDGYLTREYIEDIKISSALHDIGKVGIQDSILLKPGKLTDDEFDEMKHHTLYGEEVISEIEKNIAGRTIYTIGKEIALYHHEKWDGSGYPFGLKGRDIPLSARIISIVDVYDALTSRRPYKEPMSHEKAIIIITENSGKHFDPLMVEAFLMNETKFRIISDSYKFM